MFLAFFLLFLPLPLVLALSLSLHPPKKDAATATDPESKQQKIHWRKGELIGKGAFGKVYMGRNEHTGELIAVKQVKLTTAEAQEQAHNIVSEIGLLQNLRHPNVVNLLQVERYFIIIILIIIWFWFWSMMTMMIAFLSFHFFVHSPYPLLASTIPQCRLPDKLNILMEFVPGKSLDTMLERFGHFSEKVIRKSTSQILQALAYCHANHVVHRDIKSKNILVDTAGNLKLCDFGSAKRFESKSPHFIYLFLWPCVSLGESVSVFIRSHSDILSKDAPSLNYNYTPLWTAPEVLTGNYNSKVDIWSLGCVIIEMATGKPPWSDMKFENPFRALYHIGNSGAIPSIPTDTLSPAAVAFIKRCLTRSVYFFICVCVSVCVA